MHNKKRVRPQSARFLPNNSMSRGFDSVPIPDLRFIDFTTIPPEPIVGPCPLGLNRAREDHMRKLLEQSLIDYGVVLAVVGIMHAGVLACRFEQQGTDVELFQMTTGL